MVRFDDSERLDKLEGQMGKVQAALDALTKQVEALTKDLGGSHKALETKVETLDFDVYRQIGDIRKVRLEPIDKEVAKLDKEVLSRLLKKSALDPVFGT